MSDDLPVDAVALRDEVRAKYRDVAVNPHGSFHFHAGRPLARHLGYDEAVVVGMPERAIEAFAGVGNPFSHGMLKPGERVVDLGSGGGFDCFVAAGQVGEDGRVVGIDMTDEMLERSRGAATQMGLGTVEFRRGIIEDMPIEDGWADVVISNGVINLCADKLRVFSEVIRMLEPGGRLRFADIANGREVPAGALRNIDLWTELNCRWLPCAGWQQMLEQSRFEGVRIGAPVDTFGGAGGESKALFEVFGYAFIAHKPK